MSLGVNHSALRGVGGGGVEDLGVCGVRAGKRRCCYERVLLERRGRRAESIRRHRQGGAPVSRSHVALDRDLAGALVEHLFGPTHEPTHRRRTPWLRKPRPCVPGRCDGGSVVVGVRSEDPQRPNVVKVGDKHRYVPAGHSSVEYPAAHALRPRGCPGRSRTGDGGPR